MLLESLNSSERHISPLQNDPRGRFSRKGKRHTDEDEENKDPYGYLLGSTFIALLLMTDLLLFVGFGDVESFRCWLLPNGSVLMLMLLSILFSCIINLPSIKYPKLTPALVAVFSFWFVFAISKQFGFLSGTMMLGASDVPIYIFVGLLLAGIMAVIFADERIIGKLLALVAAAIVFIDAYTSFPGKNDDIKFKETYNQIAQSQDSDSRFIYLMFPNLSSYQYLTQASDEYSKKTKRIMLGFYQKNNFTYYPKAFLAENGFFGNSVLGFNPSSKNDSTELVTDTNSFPDYWLYTVLRNEHVFLKENELYDYFQNKGFQISAYKSRRFDICQKNHGYNVQRCTEKNIEKTDIYGQNMTLAANSNELLIEWLDSMRIVKNTSSLFDTIRLLTPGYESPLVGRNYNNPYVLNSINTFDVMFDDIKKDSGKQAYFAFLDIPSDMYIYDEYCRIKPREQWISINELPWNRSNNTVARRRAYMQQTQCLFGKMQQFVNKLRKNGLLDNTTLVIQSTSGVNDFKNGREDNYINEFINNRLSNIAIYKAENTKKQPIDWIFCSTNNIISDYIYGTNKCTELKFYGMHESAYRKINRKIEDLSHSILRDYTKEFGNFYDEWLKINPDENEITVNEEVSDDIFAETEIEADVKIADESVADFATEIAVDSDINDTENFGL